MKNILIKFSLIASLSTMASQAMADNPRLVVDCSGPYSVMVVQPEGHLDYQIFTYRGDQAKKLDFKQYNSRCAVPGFVPVLRKSNGQYWFSGKCGIQGLVIFQGTKNQGGLYPGQIGFLTSDNQVIGSAVACRVLSWK